MPTKEEPFMKALTPLANRPAAEARPELVYLRGLLNRESVRSSVASLRTVAGMYGMTLETLPWERLRYQHFAAVKADLARSRYAPSSANKMLSHVRQCLRQSWLLGHMTAEDWQKVNECEGISYSQPPAGRALSEDEVAALMRTCTGPFGTRDGAILACMHDGALRRSEVSGLDLEDYADGRLRVRGKGRKVRVVPVSKSMRLWLEAWLRERGTDAGPLFYSRMGRSGARPVRMSDKAVCRVVERRAEAAGIECTAHDLRRTALTLMLENGADFGLPQKLAGHSSPQTTARYDRRGEKLVRRAMERRRYPGPFRVGGA